jgi:catechol 2,3-dioxygenase-like lactoylglutathione lyase family enzyme
MFTGIEHLAIAAHDPEALAAWYGRTLNFRTFLTFDNGPEKPKTCMIGISATGPLIEIIPATREKPLSSKENLDPGISHVAITVSDFDAAVAALDRAGTKKEGAERPAPYKSRVQFYRDPEGNLFHLLFRPTALPISNEAGTVNA